MDWQRLKENMNLDPAYSPRTRRLMALDRVLDGTQYDHMLADFWQEDDGTTSLRIDQRRPAVKTNLIPTTVDQAISLLFGENRFPRIRGKDAAESKRFDEMALKLGLRAVMIEAAKYGSVGSVAIEIKFLSKRVFFDALRTAHLEPTWDPKEPDRLLSVRERYKARGQELIEMGYEVRDPHAQYWFTQEWTREDHIVYRPVKVNAKDQSLRAWDGKGAHHQLGEVPIIWVKNLPGGKGPDGASSFELAISNVIELDYCESQAARAVRYMGDPTLAVLGGSLADDGPIEKGPNRVLEIPDAGAKAEILEITGGSMAAFDNEAKRLRNLALGAMHGDQHDPNRLSAATSGRAMELLHQVQIWLADRLRVAYGPAIAQIFIQIENAMKRGYDVTLDGKPIEKFDPSNIQLAWGAWFDPTFVDLGQLAGATTNLVDGAILSHETGTQFVAPVFDIPDVEAERKQIAAEQAELEARLARQQAQTNATTQEPN